MRLVIYTRLSQGNDKEEESHEGQVARVTAWADKHGHEIVAHYRDTMSGETELMAREGLAGALDAMKAGVADGLLFDKLDRLARDFLVQETILRDVWGEGHEAFSAVESEANLRNDPEDPSRKMLRVIIGAVNGYERDMAALRMARGRRRAVKQGRLIGPAPKFGWVSDPDDRGRPVPDPETFHLVEEAVRRSAAGESLRSIAAYLAEQTDRTWAPVQVSRVLNRHARYGHASAQA